MALFQDYGSSNDVTITYASGTVGPTNWNNIINVQTTGTSIASASLDSLMVRSDAQGGSGNINSRAFLWFDTSVIPNDAEIISAQLEYRITLRTGSSADIEPMYAVVGTFTPGSLTTSSYGSLDKTKVFGSHSINLNANTMTITGLQYIEKADFTKIVLITNSDMNTVSPGTTRTERSATIASQNHATSSYRPLLSVTYEVGGTVSQVII